MKRTLLLLAIVAAACGQRQTGAVKPQANSEMRTIDSVPLHPAAVEPPPVVAEESAPLKSAVNVAQADAPPPPTAQDEALRSALPFSPAIAMDPIDGSKISIRVSTPTLEYKNKIYYFSSEDHKRAFAATPDQYTKGLFSHL